MEDTINILNYGQNKMNLKSCPLKGKKKEIMSPKFKWITNLISKD